MTLDIKYATSLTKNYKNYNLKKKDKFENKCNASVALKININNCKQPIRKPISQTGKAVYEIVTAWKTLLLNGLQTDGKRSF